MLGLAVAALQFFPFYRLPGLCGARDGPRIRICHVVLDAARGNAELLPSAFLRILDGVLGTKSVKLHSEYVGLSFSSMAGLGFGAVGGGEVSGSWGSSGAVATLVALGGHTPFYRLWYLLPMMKVVRAPAMIFFIAQLAIAVFAAIGLERLLREGVKRTYLIGWGVFAVVILSSRAGEPSPPSRSRSRLPSYGARRAEHRRAHRRGRALVPLRRPRRSR